MTLESRIAFAFGLDDTGWARHANPWSGWTRMVTAPPLLVAAIWSHHWLGYWSLIPVALALFWIWLNPRAFGPAKDDRAWITKCVLGERLWSMRKQAPVPERHQVIPNLLNIAALAGLPFLIWGLAALQPWPLCSGWFSSSDQNCGTSTGWRSSTRTWSKKTRTFAITGPSRVERGVRATTSQVPQRH